MDRITIPQWIAWIIAAAVGSFTLLTFAYGKFETKERADERNALIMKSLDKLDGKLDQLIIPSRRR